MAQYGPLAHFVGNTKIRRKIKHQSRTDGNNRGKASKLVTYCPFCTIQDMGHPESASRAVVSSFTIKGSCSKGHTWLISTRAYSDDRYKEGA
jgi:hypothetical protein